MLSLMIFSAMIKSSFFGLLTYYEFNNLINYNRGGLMSVSMSEVLNMYNPKIIDIRDNYSYNLGHIKNAINIPYYNLLNNYSHYLNKQEKYYLYCDNGKQSLEISNRLNLFGYNTVNIIGGYDEYSNYKYY